VFSRVSPDGEECYPGQLRAQVSYTLGEDNSLTLDYSATTDAPTILNLTNHTYFDLSAGAAPDALGHLLTLRASRFTPVSAGLIPTGELAPVHHTPFDFRTPHAIGERISAVDAQLRHGAGYDHNWVLDPAGDADEPPISVFEPVSGGRLDVWTTEPGVQFYSGNRLAPLVGKGQRRYGCRSGFCLETQHVPDSPSHPTFPSTVLRPGTTFRSRTLWKFDWR
jgi:aldose 1-epimerase